MTGLPLNIDISQIFLHLFNFAILFGIVYFLLYKPIKSFMDRRMDYYSELDINAKGKLDEAEKIRSEYEEKMQKSDALISEMRKNAREQAASEATKEIEAAKAEAENILKNARIKAKKEADTMIELANDQISDLLSDAAKKLLSDNVSDSYDEFLDMAERGEEDEEI